MKNYKYIFLDLDGTLTDPAEGITNSIMYSLKKFDIEVSDRTKLYKFIGPPLIDSFKEFYGFEQEKALKAVEYYREYFNVDGLYENKMYEGIEEVLKTLKLAGKTLVLATSKPEKFAKIILEHFGLIQYFDYVAGATMDGKINYKHEVIEHALNMCNQPDISQIIMIGDRKFDILGAKQFGIDSMGVLYGYGNKEELDEAGADYIVNTPEEILKILVWEY